MKVLKQLSLCLILLMCLTLTSCGTKGLMYELSVDKTYYTVTGLEGASSRRLTIPKKHKGKPVKEIGFDAFKGCTSFTTVSLPKTMTTIYSGAFANCTNLIEIELPENIEFISVGLFEGCTNLENVKMHNNIESIGENAFKDCTKLETIKIPSSVEEIGFNAFSGCTNLKSIELPLMSNKHFGYIFGAEGYYKQDEYIPETLKEVVVTGGNTIKSNSFSNCENIEIIKIVSGINTIEYSCFTNCKNLKEIIINECVTTIKGNIFSKDLDLTIYCQVKEKPSGWSNSWNSLKYPVYWGYIE